MEKRARAKPARSERASTGGTSEQRALAGLREHPRTDLVPAIDDQAFRVLRADIEARGLQVPLEATPTGVVLDGRARLRAARELGFEHVAVRVLAPADECEHMLRAALLRRQLSASQRAALALKLLPYEELREQAQKRQRANLRQYTEVATLPARGGRTRDALATLAGTKPRTAQDVMTVAEHDLALFERVLQGEVAAHRAARSVRRARRDAALAQTPPLPPGAFELILADPPWQLGSPDSDRAPENHYPTMSLDEIASLAVPAAEDALLYLWAVSSLLPQALAVMEAWGFSYRTNMVWVKDKIGLGTWARHRHELLLIGRKGSFPPPAEAVRPDSVIEAKRRRHSQKPLCVYELLEQMYPRTRKLELFARGSRRGWSSWGNELPSGEATE